VTLVSGEGDLLVEAVVHTADRMAPGWRKWLWYLIQATVVIVAVVYIGFLR
jgi:hypothetical protein